MGPAKEAWGQVWQGVLPPPPADVLEVAAGTGQMALLLAELGHRVVGIDLAEGMLSLAAAKSADMANAPTLLLGDAVMPAFPPASFDAVVSRYVLWTLREPRLALANWRQLLRPGGLLIAIDGPWFADGRRSTEGYDDQVMASLPLACATPVEAFVAMVGEVGFSDVQVTLLHQMERLERELLEDASEVRLLFAVTARTK